MPKNVADWHRQQHKKDLAKNKTARIAARDEKVKTEKTEHDVLEAIRKIERQHKNADNRPHPIKSRLDRLEKELKLVREEKEKKKTKVPEKRHVHEPVFKPLAHPAISIYYDPVLNPFGEPPPGKPRLYHRADGSGVTMSMEEAGVPGENTGDRTQTSDRHSMQPSSTTTQYQYQSAFAASNQGTKTTRTDVSNPPPPPPPLPSANEKKKPNALELPSLPPPSAAVGRSRRKLAADIWASTEEMEYEEAVGIGTLEGVAVVPAPSVNSQWYYRDTLGQVQGPFSTDQMLAWVHAGFFPLNTLLRVTSEGPWKELRQVQLFASSVSQSAVTNPGPKKNTSVQDRIAALRQERLREQEAALSQESTPHNHERGNNTGSEHGVQDAAESSQECEVPVTEHENGDLSDESDSVQRRIASLREQHIRAQDDSEQAAPLHEKDSLDRVDADSITNPIEPVSNQQRQSPPTEQDHEDLSDESDSVRRRIAMLRAEHIRARDGVVDESEQITSEQVDADSVKSPIGPVPYPVDEEPSSYVVGPSDEVAPYPLEPSDYPVQDNEMSDVPYPVEAPYSVIDEYMNDVPYPVDDDDPDAYPVTGEYPISHDDDDDADYPVTGAYSSEEVVAEASVPEAGEPARKKVKVDKELVALLPSHIQKRKLAKHR